ncbi:MAG TPA: hypothetical protein VGP88_01320 [Thermoplasmata archaeon]|nr:hypothetical protein [Thermoplasmata archaeon]
MTHFVRSGRARRALPPGLAIVAVLAAALVAGPAMAAGAAPGVSHSFASYNAGRVSVVVPSAHPSVELVANSNASVNALLSATEVVELAPSGSSYDVVAAAAPTLAGSFNGSRPAGVTTPWALSLAADLAVRPSNGDLWNGSTSTAGPAVGAAFGFAELRVDFAPGATTSSGSSLLVSWNVSNWPIANPHDLLGVVYSFSAAGAGQIRDCAAATALAAPACPGATLSSAHPLFNGASVGVEAESSSGSVASLSWSPSATNGTVSPALSGAQIDPAGGADVVVAAAPTPTSGAVGALSFAIYAPGPTLKAPTTIVLGSGPAYLVAAAIAAGAALAGLALYRERDERLRAEL